MKTDFCMTAFQRIILFLMAALIVTAVLYVPAIGHYNVGGDYSNGYMAVWDLGRLYVMNTAQVIGEVAVILLVGTCVFFACKR